MTFAVVLVVAIIAVGLSAGPFVRACAGAPPGALGRASRTRSSISSTRSTAAGARRSRRWRRAAARRSRPRARCSTACSARACVAPHGQEFELTPEGERLALQIVRAHRLLERYFADEARLPLRRRSTRRPNAGALAHARRGRTRCRRRSAIRDSIRTAIRFPTRDGAVCAGRRHAGRPPGRPDTFGRIVHLEDEPQICVRADSRGRAPRRTGRPHRRSRRPTRSS